MSGDKEDFLGNIVEGIKKSLDAQADDYVTVLITVLIGEEKEVIEAVAEISIDQDDMPCKSAVITMSGWKGKANIE